MPLVDPKNGKTYPFMIYQADKFLPRLIGLLGTSQSDPHRALHIDPCSSIHTFWMKYTIDVLFLDKDGCIVHAIPNLQANKITKNVANAKSVLELPAGSILKHNLKVGDRLDIHADQEYRPNIDALKNLFHWPVNVFIALMWSKFVLLAVTDLMLHRDPLNLGILIHNTLLFLLFLTRRKSTDTSYRIIDWVVPICVMTFVMLLRIGRSTDGTFYLVSGIFQTVGIAGMIVSLASLGRSFGVIPANRRIKYSGAYKIVRHPLYTSEIIFYIGFLIGNLTIRNCLFVVLIMAGQFWRSLAEEKLLSKDIQYRSYLNSVQYRFIPGLF